MTRIFLSAPDVRDGDRDALLAAFDSGWVTPAGPELAAFEAETGITVKVLKAGDVGKAKDIGDKYEAGRFDAMSDCYNFAPGAWGEVFGDVRYVFVYGEGS